MSRARQAVHQTKNKKQIEACQGQAKFQTLRTSWNLFSFVEPCIYSKPVLINKINKIKIFVPLMDLTDHFYLMSVALKATVRFVLNGYMYVFEVP